MVVGRVEAGERLSKISVMTTPSLSTIQSSHITPPEHRLSVSHEEKIEKNLDLI